MNIPSKNQTQLSTNPYSPISYFNVCIQKCNHLVFIYDLYVALLYDKK